MSPGALRAVRLKLRVKPFYLSEHVCLEKRKVLTTFTFFFCKIAPFGPPAHSLWSRILEEGGRVSSHPRARADALYAGDSLLHVGAGADRHGGVAEAGCRPWCVGARHILRAGVHA